MLFLVRLRLCYRSDSGCWSLKNFDQQNQIREQTAEELEGSNACLWQSRKLTIHPFVARGVELT